MLEQHRDAYRASEGRVKVGSVLDRKTNQVFPFDTKERCSSEEVCVV